LLYRFSATPKLTNNQKNSISLFFICGVTIWPTQPYKPASHPQYGYNNFKKGMTMTTSKKLSVLALAALMSAGIMTSSPSFAGDHANACAQKEANGCKANACKHIKKETNACKTNTCKQKEANSCNGLKQSDFNK
jgi:hypothetical protein